MAIFSRFFFFFELDNYNYVFLKDVPVSVHNKCGVSCEQVPKGWDKLFVSIISKENGKTIAKSGKALVRNGSCQWADIFSQSVLVSRDNSSKEMEDCLLKLLVSTVLGYFHNCCCCCHHVLILRWSPPPSLVIKLSSSFLITYLYNPCYTRKFCFFFLFQWHNQFYRLRLLRVIFFFGFFFAGFSEEINW